MPKTHNVPDPGDFQVYSTYDITPGLANAIQVWSELLTGVRGRSWGTASAAYFLTSIGFAPPREPMSPENLRRLRIVADFCEKLRDKGTEVGPKDLKRAEKAMSMAEEFRGYFRDNCSGDFDPDAPPTNRVNDTCNGLETAAAVAKSTYASPEAVTASYYDLVPPEHFDYEQIPDALDDMNILPEEREIVDPAEGTDYFRPPPPESTFEAIGE